MELSQSPQQGNDSGVIKSLTGNKNNSNCAYTDHNCKQGSDFTSPLPEPPNRAPIVVLSGTVQFRARKGRQAELRWDRKHHDDCQDAIVGAIIRCAHDARQEDGYSEG